MSARAIQVLLLSGVLVLAEQTFQWGFTNSVSNSLPLCGKLPISITPLPNAPANATGVPPYYLISFAVGSSSAPMTSLIGTNASVVDWTVRHPVGSQLILEVVDSTGASGGIDVPLYGVIAGTTSQCLPPRSSQAPFTVSSLTSNGATLNTCDLWTLFFKGGKPPYTVTIAALNTPDVTNMTLGPMDTKLEWPNRADPGSQMIGTSAPNPVTPSRPVAD
ncbi:hypothetical protein C8F01DRAFT_36523 [Mycena amicta]|nr:hypothetical protein C8F01DRAFT_36523 [Mycena amicta]